MSPLTRRELLLSLPAVALARRLVGQAAPAPIRLRGLHQVTLAVSDLGRSIDFYQTLFGMAVQAREGSKVLLRIGDGPRFLALTEAGSGPPRIDHWGMSVVDFDAGRVLESLSAHGVRRVAGGGAPGLEPMSARLSERRSTPELHLADPDGLVIQLQDPTDCGGAGALGNRCPAPEPAPRRGDLALRGLNHLTINVADPERSNAFYRRAFGLDIQAHQAASPLLGVGPGSDFLMFIGGGDGGARINHACFTVEGFDVERIQAALERQGIRPRGAGASASDPLLHWVSMRMPNRGGAPEGTPELYFSDPDGLRIQLQDETYCGGGGVLGEVC